MELGLPYVPNVTKLVSHTDVYVLWPGATPVAVGTSLAPMPPPADDDEDDE
jgi:hypothetical protein